MTSLKILKEAVAILDELNCHYCLVGGHAASLYRVKERLTRDVDFALMGRDSGDSREIASICISKLDLTAIPAFIPVANEENDRKSIYLMTSAPTEESLSGIIDILLPELPWVEEAVLRAQENKLHLGFAYVPVITPDDLVIAKCYALRNNPDRFQDLDDLKEIFAAIKDLDCDYTRSRLERYQLEVPSAVAKYAPSLLTRDKNWAVSSD